MGGRGESRRGYSYPGGMFVCLESQVQHLASLVAFLVHQLIADGQESRETGFNNVVEVLSVLALVGLVSESTTYGKETLQTSQRRVRIIGVQQLQGEFQESRPPAGEITLQNALQNGNKLLADEPLGGSQDGHQTVSDPDFFIFGY